MNLIYKILPYSILSIAAGFMIGMAGGETVWGYIGLGLIIASGVGTLVVGMVITFIHWRRNKASADKKLSEVSGTLIFNAIAALLLFAYVTWKDISILDDDNMFLIIWMAINLGTLRIIWVPKESDPIPKSKSDENLEEKKEEAI